MPNPKGGYPNEPEAMQREMERFLEHINACKRRSVIFNPGPWLPPADLYETADDIVVLVDIAGVSIDSISIVVEGDMLFVSGVRQPRRLGDRQSYYQLEVLFGPFERNMRLPAAVRADDSQASYKEGFLEIIMPKSPAPRAEQIVIKTASQSES